MLAVAGVGIIFGSIGIVAETIISEAASGRREAKRMREAVDALGDHYIVCGYGRVGSTVIRELMHTGQRFVVIDVHAPSLERAAADGHLVVMGDATDDATLRAAGIERARGPDHDDRLGREQRLRHALGPGDSTRACSSWRGRAPLGAEAKLAQAGANRIVSPYTMAGRRIAELAIRPRVADFIDAALSHGNLSFSLEEVEVDGESPLLGVTVGQLRADGVMTLAILQPDGAYEANPPEDARAARGREPDRVGLDGGARGAARPGVAPRRPGDRAAPGGLRRPSAASRAVSVSAAAIAAPTMPGVVEQLGRDDRGAHGQARDEPLGPLGDAAADDEQPRAEQLLDREQVLVEVRRPGLPADRRA